MPVYNKVTFNGTVLMDISNDTVDAGHLMQGYTAHDASGTAIVGTYSEPTYVTYYVSDQEPTSTDGSEGDIWLVTT